MKKVLLLSCFLLLFLVSCNKEDHTLLPLTEFGVTAKEHLVDLGYEIVSVDNENTVVFKESELHIRPTQQFWAVQTGAPDAYLEQEIHTVSFTIKNHRYDDIFGMGKTAVTVYIHAGTVMGGFSYPLSKNNDVRGALASIEGKTAEEVQEDYQRWLLDWISKYGE